MSVKFKLWFVLVAGFGLLLPFTSLAKTIRVKSAAGISAEFDVSSGRYQITSHRPDWKFAGELDQSATNAVVNTGTDLIGPYQEICFAWRAGIPMTGGIRVYDGRAVVLFTLTYGQAAEKPAAPFPRFTSFPAALHHFSFGNRSFAPPRFKLETNGTPWLLFDDRANAVLISPANNFLIASMSGDGVNEIASGLNAGVRDVPANFSHSTLVAFGGGIHAAWNSWSAAFLALLGAPRPANDADTGLRYLGYWTDNGAAYYYNCQTNLGYAGTLEKLAARYREENIPIRYFQLDSWWYYKTFTGADGKIGAIKAPKLPAGEWNRYGGLLNYEAHPAVLPGGLGGFQKEIGMPLITHNRWIDPASPYREKYTISGVAAIDPKWWDDIMGYIAANGVACYEQDWLSEIYFHSPALQTTPGLADAFADNMARAARERKLSLQYCMALPRFFLQGARYPNLTTIRTSDDRFGRSRWDSFLYTSQFARAAGIWPWADVFMSGETNNLLVSVLSAGMVGIGDALGTENRENLMRAARADGVLVKPDESLLPLDGVYVADAILESGADGVKRPMVAWTHSDHGALRTIYVFAYDRTGARPPPGVPSGKTADFIPAAFGLAGKVCVFNARSGAARFQSANQRVELPLDSDGTAYCEITPAGKSGLAFFGDEGKFASNGHQRIAGLDDADGKLTATIMFAAGEKPVRVFGFANNIPTVTAQSGSVGIPAFDPNTGRFSVDVSPADAVTNSGGDPVQTAAIVFKTR